MQIPLINAPLQLLSVGRYLTDAVLPQRDAGTAPVPDAVQDRFAALLERSTEIPEGATDHPAYLRMIDELTPDEARILRLFAQRGPQPAVDVRTKRPLGVGERVLAPGLTMIGLHAGCADADRVHAYLNNLHRLGLIWFSSEPLAVLDGYQVLEAQPEVLAALKSAGRATTRLRSIELTAFGRDFCAVCGLSGQAG